MSYTAEAGRLQIIGEAASAAGELDQGLTDLGEAYDRLDEQTADRMEEQLFRPLQAALGQLKRTRTEFAARYGLRAPELAPAPAPLPSDPHVSIDRVVESVRQADEILAELQDSMLPVDVGDQELRAGLSRTRSLIASLPARADELLRTLGR